MTSNVGARDLAAARGRASAAPAARPREADADREYKQLFSPEFRNRLDAKIAFNAARPGGHAQHRRQVHARARRRSSPSASVTIELTDGRDASTSPRRATTRTTARAARARHPGRGEAPARRRAPLRRARERRPRRRRRDEPTTKLVFRFDEGEARSGRRTLATAPRRRARAQLRRPAEASSSSHDPGRSFPSSWAARATST